MTSAPERKPRRAVAAAARTRQPTEVRRRLIVEAAVPLIAERGYASVGVRDVAAAVGVSVGTVTYHFGSVQEILSEAMVLHFEPYYAAMSEAADSAPGATQGLRLMIDTLFTDDTDRHWRMWFDYWNAGDRGDQAFARGQAERYAACTPRSVPSWNAATPRATSPATTPTTPTASPSASPPWSTASPCSGSARRPR